MNIVEALKLSNHVRRSTWGTGGYITFDQKRISKWKGCLLSFNASYFCNERESRKTLWALDKEDILANNWEAIPCEACKAESKHTCGRAS